VLLEGHHAAELSERLLGLLSWQRCGHYRPSSSRQAVGLAGKREEMVAPGSGGMAAVDTTPFMNVITFCACSQRSWCGVPPVDARQMLPAALAAAMP
jgi:hypothetical protein